MGRALLLMTGCMTLCGAPALGLDRRGWVTMIAVSAVMLLVVAASTIIDCSTLPAVTLLVFPCLVFGAFIVLSIGENARFAPVSGFMTLCYGYSGLTQRRRTSLLLLLPSSIALMCTYGGPSPQIAVRLVIASSVWVILAEVLAAFTTQHRQMTVALERAAHNDVLTGLPNRRDLDRQLSLAQPGTRLVVCDLDHFKRLNDTLGHHAGDRVLADFGSAVRAVLRTDDYCARFGGEEFVLLLPEIDSAGAEIVIDRLRKHWAVLHSAVTFSAGTARCEAGRDNAASLAAADEALYRAKAAGRNSTRHESSGDSQPADVNVGIGSARQS
ncbi:GGDEF domain-containing protein [Jatrophihabitans endophyticus]|uniref:GGDEF domain-containing protein n=1 Tax=Jatrophihabitans endophyticus TaxID=1206085 RepID=UPI0019D9F162|nr:GGDEF domain-containing protein [Jatrophihabitans endophyticus]MBE7188029.1 GGDEF domain-containing protein [Jatrophihabitans endophyticus]